MLLLYGNQAVVFLTVVVVLILEVLEFSFCCLAWGLFCVLGLFCFRIRWVFVAVEVAQVGVVFVACGWFDLVTCGLMFRGRFSFAVLSGVCSIAVEGTME